jgi:hypothetical protein
MIKNKKIILLLNYQFDTCFSNEQFQLYIHRIMQSSKTISRGILQDKFLIRWILESRIFEKRKFRQIQIRKHEMNINETQKKNFCTLKVTRKAFVNLVNKSVSTTKVFVNDGRWLYETLIYVICLNNLPVDGSNKLPEVLGKIGMKYRKGD